MYTSFFSYTFVHIICTFVHEIHLYTLHWSNTIQFITNLTKHFIDQNINRNLLCRWSSFERFFKKFNLQKRHKTSKTNQTFEKQVKCINLPTYREFTCTKRHSCHKPYKPLSHLQPKFNQTLPVTVNFTALTQILSHQY